MNKSEDNIHKEAECMGTKSTIFGLRGEEKTELLERGLFALYRVYLSRSQSARNWNPDTSFNWRDVRKDHNPHTIRLLEGFYAVEQFVPDYTSDLVRLFRQNYGRSQLQMRWGAEEAKHADVWRNALLFTKGRQSQWLEESSRLLRKQSWKLPFNDALRMLFYTVLQERATQVVYLNFAKLVGSDSITTKADSVLAEVATTVAIDEAAHYNFFLDASRLYLYYFPEESLEALDDVVCNFKMPAADLIPAYTDFSSILHSTELFGAEIYLREVICHVFSNLGILHQQPKLAITAEKGDAKPNLSAFGHADFDRIEIMVNKLYSRITKYEQQTGLFDVAPTVFVRNVLGQKAFRNKGIVSKTIYHLS